MHLLEIKDITYGVEDKKSFSFLSLSIKPHEVHAILGTNGSGKTTLAYLIMGYEGYLPASGKILFKGSSLKSLKLNERTRLGITLAWQEPVRFEGISVRDYLTLKDKEADPSRYLEMVGLVAEGHNILSMRAVDGLEVRAKETPLGISANVVVNIKEKIVLAGEKSKGLIKARVAIEDSARAEVTSITEGNAKGARGHVDCVEIVKDNAFARAVPIVNVSHPLAKVTHEAAMTMKNPCDCVPEHSVPCCPADKKLRKEWLITLEKEHRSLKNTSNEIAGKFKILSNSDRVEILLMLEQREHCMDEITRKLETRKSAASYHLGLLKKHSQVYLVPG